MPQEKDIISVIVPIYNAEKYITYCLESIRAQTYRNLEVLMVDDGSTDGTAALLDGFVRKDSRFKAIHRPNGGESAARNMGLDAATGKYINFVDSDDYMHPRTLELLYGVMQKNEADLAVAPYRLVPEYRAEHYTEATASHTLLTQRQMTENLYQGNNIDTLFIVVWGKLYPRELIGDTRFRATAIEDLDFNARIYLKATRGCALLDNTLYYWVTRNLSLSRSGMNRRTIGQLATLEGLLPLYSDKRIRGLVLYKLYKRLLSIRHQSRHTPLHNEARDAIRATRKRTLREFITSPGISCRRKAIITLLWHLPFLYTAMTGYYEWRARR